MRRRDPELRGVVIVQIGADGLVTGASIETSLDPTYDARLLAATTQWRYQPATLNGSPIASTKVVAYRIGD
jgi:TonB family protein